MKIYLANLAGGTFSASGRASHDAMLTRELAAREYPYDLESYHYIAGAERPIGEYYQEIGKRIFLDSGAFTMFTKGVKVNLEEYADFVKRNRAWVDIAASLDIIGRGVEQGSWDNQKKLEALGAGTVPVHHARDDDKWLTRYMAEGYDYILLGGMVAEQTKYLRGWLDHIWDKHLTHKDGSAKIRVHGLGLTTFELMFKYPWYSVDSASWILHSSYGNILIDLPDRDMPLLVAISKDRACVHEKDKHFDTLSPAAQKRVREAIEAQGYDVEKLRTEYGWRENWNIRFFSRMMDRKVHNFKRREVSLFE